MKEKKIIDQNVITHKKEIIQMYLHHTVMRKRQK